MLISDSPVVTTEPPLVSAAPSLSGFERRESERAIAYWQSKSTELGTTPTVAALDLAQMNSDGWSHRFVIAVDPLVENSALMMYGANFARLLGLPAKSAPHLPMIRQLPRHLSDVFVRGCGDAHQHKAPVRINGEIPLGDGRTERYRAAFIPVGVKPNSLTHLAFGAFNSCIN